MQMKLTYKFSLFAILLVGFTITILTVIANYRTANEITTRIKNQALLFAQTSKEEIFAGFLNITDKEEEKIEKIKNIADMIDNIISIRLLSPSGIIIFDYDKLNVGKLTQNSFILDKTINREMGYQVINNIMQIVTPYTKGGLYLGVVKIELSLDNLNLLIKQNTIINILIGLGIIMFSSVLSFFFAGLITRPLMELALNIKNLSLGKYEEPIKIKSKGEIAEFASVFNKMRQRLLWERKRLSYNIHDTLTQNLSAIAMQLKNQKGISVKKQKYLKDIIDQTIQQTRQIIFELNPVTIVKEEFIYNISKYLTMIEKQSNFKLEFITNFNHDNELKSNKKVLLSELITNFEMISFMYIIIEAINNIKKHSNARNVLISLLYENNKLILTIEDDGIGCNLNEIHNKEEMHFGLKSILERSEIIGSNIYFKTKPGKGLKITIIKETESMVLNE